MRGRAFLDGPFGAPPTCADRARPGSEQPRQVLGATNTSDLWPARNQLRRKNSPVAPRVGRAVVDRTYRRADVTHPHTHESSDLDGPGRVTDSLTWRPVADLLVGSGVATRPLPRVLAAGWPRFPLCSRAVRISVGAVLAWPGGRPWPCCRPPARTCADRFPWAGLINVRLMVPPSGAVSNTRGLLGGSSSAARVHPCRASCRGATPPDTSQGIPLVGSGGVAARWEVWQPSGAPSREGHRPDHHPTPVSDSLTRGEVGSSEAGARVQGGAPGPRRAVESREPSRSASTSSPRALGRLRWPGRGTGAPHGSKTGVRACQAQRAGHRRRPGAGGSTFGGAR